MQQEDHHGPSGSIYAQELARFAADLTAFRIDHGKPTLEDIEKQAPTGRTLSRSAVSEALNGKRLPSLDFLIALVRTLLKLEGHRGLEVSLGDSRLEVWRSRWQQLQKMQAMDRREAPAPAAAQVEQSLPAPGALASAEDRRTLRMFVAMPGSSMGQQATWDDIPAIRRRLLEPIATQIEEQLACKVDLVIEKEKSPVGTIRRAMFAEAVAADMYIADLTGANPNVYMELGVRWALSDNVTIPICQDITEVRFNAIDNRVIKYGPMPDDLVEAIDRIARAAIHGLDNPQHIDSPVREGSTLIQVSRAEFESMYDELGQLRHEQAQDLIEAALNAPDPPRRIELLEQAIARNPASWRAYFELGSTLRREGRYDEAGSACRTAVELKPDFAPAWRELGITMGKDGHSDDKAIEAFDRALALDDQDAETWATQGGLLRRLARKHTSGSIDIVMLEHALACYRRANDLMPKKLYPLMNAARIELLLAGLRGADLKPSLAEVKNLEHLARFDLSNSQSADPWARFDLADTLLLTGRHVEGLAELRAAALLIAEEERTATLTSVAEPLRDFLAITNALAPETVDAIRQALQTCTSLSTTVT